MKQNEILSKLKGIIDSQEDPITTDEAHKYLGISKSTLFKMTSARKIPFYKNKRFKRIYFLKSELRLWLLENPVRINSHIEKDAINYIYSKNRKK